jgi:hypothetical protein
MSSQDNDQESSQYDPKPKEVQQFTNDNISYSRKTECQIKKDFKKLYTVLKLGVDNTRIHVEGSSRKKNLPRLSP